jgi:hypothetical protein
LEDLRFGLMDMNRPIGGILTAEHGRNHGRR